MKLTDSIILATLLYGTNGMAATDYQMAGAAPVEIWKTGSSDYLYDQSIVYTGRSDGLYFMYSCGLGAPNDQFPWDAIKLQRSNDGVNWTAPVVALAATPGGQDQYAACNPSVFADTSTGYWYMTYTAATSPVNFKAANAIFVARATDPNGPWVKWNGVGWGGSPHWMIPPDPNATGSNPEGCASILSPGCYGIGEPSVVLAYDGIYVFFTQWNRSGDYEGVWVFSRGQNWPQQLAWSHLIQPKFYTATGMHEGPWDVKLVTDGGLQKFMAVASVPYSDEPKVMISDDFGLTFADDVDVSSLNQHSVGCQNTSIVGGIAGDYSEWYDPFIVCGEGVRPSTLFAQRVSLSWH